MGSIPFVVFLTWKAKVFGISRKIAFSITTILSCAVLMFPWALRLGWAAWWTLFVILLIISSSILIKSQLHEGKISNKLLGYINKAEDIPNVEERPKVQEELKIMEQTPVEDGQINDGQINDEHVHVHQLTVDELVDLGFKEKHSENFRQAANYFSRALALGPPPDLAFYLIVDCYWLLKNIDQQEYALNALKGHSQLYLSQFNPELRHRFEVWMDKENIMR